MSTLIPDTFIPFLGALSFEAESPNVPPIATLWPDTPGRDARDHKVIYKAVSLYSHETVAVTIDGFRQKLLHVLRDAKHVATTQIADAILGCVVKAAATGRQRAAFLEDLLASFATAEVSHFFVVPADAIAEPIRFEGYTLGPIDFSVLASRSRRAQSDFAELYRDQIVGRFTLQSPEFRHTIINFVDPMAKLGLVTNKRWRDLLLNYFTHVSRQHLEFMWSHLDRTQVLAAAFGAELLDVQNFRNEIGKFGHQITIYLEFCHAKTGYVVPELRSLFLHLPGSDSEASRRYLSHRDLYHLPEVGDSELGRTLIACGGFCQQAIRFLELGRPEDAALYATICLEYLFSEKKSTAEAVCTRAAVVTHRRLAVSFEKAEKELRKLYDARSAFVHSGAAIGPAQAERLIDYARETLRNMLLLHLKTENRTQGFLKKFVRDLDFIVAGFEAGKTFDESFLTERGITKS
jgi:hypothetical protein